MALYSGIYCWSLAITHSWVSWFCRQTPCKCRCVRVLCFLHGVKRKFYGLEDGISLGPGINNSEGVWGHRLTGQHVQLIVLLIYWPSLSTLSALIFTLYYSQQLEWKVESWTYLHEFWEDFFSIWIWYVPFFDFFFFFALLTVCTRAGMDSTILWSSLDQILWSVVWTRASVEEMWCFSLSFSQRDLNVQQPRLVGFYSYTHSNT